ncbi:hypothetical protein [Dictyobacter arantiisoli]|uniref:hypothetical protein n=1 Tax=Dictyobacter arantiisoli TaxID=2014874 RepID=UPI0011F01F39|nr:hypothetical protein [Dictyobacter arantiisoli]
MLKAVATALVLIAGAAVVLWYANTLNSWVVGGLIGGLAALLISIPISLIIFTYLARRHDERTAQDDEADSYERSLRPRYVYREVPERMAQNVYVEAERDYEPAHRGVWGEEYEECDEYDIYEAAYDENEFRDFPEPIYKQIPRLPAARQQSLSRAPSTRRNAMNNEPFSETEARSRRKTTRRLNQHQPIFPGYQPEMTRGQFQSQALRIAREEAYRRIENAEDIPSSALPPSQKSQERDYPPTTHEYRHTYRERQDATAFPRNARQGRRIVDANPLPNSTVRPDPEFSQKQDRLIETYKDPETETLPRNYATGDLKKPLVRRAPYMYDDDPLKMELAQQVEPPVIKRSTRHLSTKPDEE